MELYLIRHGQSSNNASEAVGLARVCDPPLTDVGQQQARLVAERLKHLDWTRESPHDGGNGLRLTRLYTSPMLRALETAEAIRQATGLIPYVWIDVYEQGGIWLDYGDGRGAVGLPGMGRREMQEQFPHFVLPTGVREDGWWNRPWEDEASAYVRAQRVVDELRELANSDERIGIISHGGFGSFLIDALLGLPCVTYQRFSMDNTAVSRIDLTPDRIRLRFSNRTDHMPGELVT